MKNRILLIMLSILMIAGCSSRQIYDSFQYSQRNECMKLPESQYNECLERTNKPFNQYEKERGEALDK